MRPPRLLPGLELCAPVVGIACAGGDPHLQADGARIASGLPHVAAKFVEFAVGNGACRMRQHDPTIAPSGDASQRCLLMAAEPERYSAARRQGIDAGVLNRMPLSLEADMELRR